jgi:hypothetical protein
MISTPNETGSITSVLHQQASQTALANKFCNIMKA